MRKCIFVAIILAIVGCNTKKRQLIPEDDLVDILVDIHLAEALFKVTRIKTQKFSIYDSLDIYDSVVVQHGYTKAQYDSTLAYYSDNITKFKAIYDKVIEKLNKLEGEVIDELKGPDKPPEYKDKNIKRLPIRNIHK